MNTPDSTFSDDFVYIYDMMGIGHGKRTGRSMKHFNNIVAMTAFLLCLCNVACDPNIDGLPPPCGVDLNIDVPKGADSIHVYFYNGGSVNMFFKDSVGYNEKNVSFEASSRLLEQIEGWQYGNFYLKEIAYFGKDSVSFPLVEISLSPDKFAAISIQNEYKLPDEYYKTFSPEENKSIFSDQYYQIWVQDNMSCIEREF